MHTQDYPVQEATLKLPNHIASNLKALRRAQGWSQTELANRVGLNRGNIASYESGSAEPNICKTLRISKLFGISPRDLIRDDLSKPSTLARARSAFRLNEAERYDRIAALRDKANQLNHLVASSRRLYEYKRANLSKPCPDAELLAAHYEQLYQVTQQLLETQQGVFAELGCACSHAVE